jgi:hypothetical protein
LISGAAEFRVLDPKIGFDLLKRTQERQNCDIALGDWRVIIFWSSEGYRAGRQYCRADCRGTRYHPGLQKGSTISGTSKDASLFFH